MTSSTHTSSFRRQASNAVRAAIEAEFGDVARFEQDTLSFTARMDDDPDLRMEVDVKTKGRETARIRVRFLGSALNPAQMEACAKRLNEAGIHQLDMTPDSIRLGGVNPYKLSGSIHEKPFPPILAQAWRDSQTNPVVEPAASYAAAPAAHLA